MNRTSAALLFPLVLCLSGFALSSPAPRTVDLKSADGTPLKGTYFTADRPGPGVILYHQGQPDARVVERRRMPARRGRPARSHSR
jgi:hypothetical protein